jgi:hypothetical protein
MTGRVDDLYDDVPAEVDVMGAAVNGGHGARVAAQDRHRDRASGTEVLSHVVHRRSRHGGRRSSRLISVIPS